MCTSAGIHILVCRVTSLQTHHHFAVLPEELSSILSGHSDFAPRLGAAFDFTANEVSVDRGVPVAPNLSEFLLLSSAYNYTHAASGILQVTGPGPS